MDFRKYSVDKIPRQAHQTGLQGRLGSGAGRGGGGGMCKPPQPLEGPWVPSAGEHPARVYAPLPAVTGANESACCHEVPLGTRGDGLPRLGGRLRSPNPATWLCLQGSQQSNDLPIPSSRPCGLCKRPCPSSWCSSPHSFQDPFSSWAPQVMCKDLTCMRMLTLLPHVTWSVTLRFKPHSLLSFHWTMSSQTSGRLFLPRDPLPTLRTRPRPELVLPNRR